MTHKRTPPRRPENPLLEGIERVAHLVGGLKERARRFFQDVSLSGLACPDCGGSLTMIAPSRCRCACGREFDPTLEFQRSLCCGVRLRRQRLHYVCDRCGETVPSRFLFDERLFDAEYFAEKMRESRERRRMRREQIRERIAGARSGALCLAETPDLEAVPGLVRALDDFIGVLPPIPVQEFRGRESFRLSEFRLSILDEVPPGCLIAFDAIAPICKERRLDRVRKFITLVFMEQAREVCLIQDDDDIMVEVYETHAKGR